MIDQALQALLRKHPFVEAFEAPHVQKLAEFAKPVTFARDLQAGASFQAFAQMAWSFSTAQRSTGFAPFPFATELATAAEFRAFCDRLPVEMDAFLDAFQRLEGLLIDALVPAKNAEAPAAEASPPAPAPDPEPTQP